ncbi:hypothetical protein JW964_28005 [candidate division KSB1 bacterium]|nr:hypothetical protein [candidate division KSB1 bacterium]
MDNKVSAELAQQALEEILKGINQITQNLPFLITLTTDEKKSLPKFGDKSVAFVKRSYELAQQHKNILPASFELAEMGRDINLYEKLYSIQQPLRTLFEKIEDTLQELGAESYSSALYIYALIKMHKDIGDIATETFDDLAKRFIKKSSSNPEE